MKKLVFLAFLLLLIPVVFSVKDKESLMIDYNFTSMLFINYTKEAPFYLNYTAYVAPQDVEVIEQSLKNGGIIKEEESFLTNVIEEETNKIEFGLIQKFKSKRKIYHTSFLPEFPYDIEKHPKNLSKYLEFYNYTDINDEIRNKASNIVSGSTNYLEAIQRILEWVNQNIEYDNSTDLVKSLKQATWIFENKKGVCDEFSTLTISLLRSLGMPSRYVYGYAWSDDINGFGPHAWVEIWVPNYGWIYADPTYGQFGWIDSGHIKLYSSEDSSGTVLNVIYNKGMTISSKMQEHSFGEPVKDILIISSENETKIFSGSLELSKEKAGTNDYIYLKLNLNNPNDYYIPLTVYTIKTKEMEFVEGNNYKGILVKPGQNAYFILIKTPNEGGTIHPFTVYVPLLGEFEENLTVLSSEPKTSLEEIKLEISSEKQEVKELEIKDINITEIIYENPLEINIKIRNKGNTEINDLLIEAYSLAFDKISYKLTKLRINEEKEINLKTNTNLEPGEKEINFYFTFENKTKNAKVNFTITTKPEIKIQYIGKNEFLEEENIDFTLIINNTKNVFLSNLILNVFLENENITKTYYPEENSIILPIILQKEFFNFGNNSLKIGIIYSDKFGLKDEVREEYNITRKATNILTIILESIKAFFLLIINFVKDLFKKII